MSFAARQWVIALVLPLSATVCLPPASADEGMWLFNDPPRKLLSERYGFEPSEVWLENLQRSAVRFNSGGSGAFVSPEGLVITNHHVGADALQKLSTAENDLLANGFYAKTREEEIRCVDLELNVLESIEDVTGKVEAAVTPEMDAAQAQQARRAVMNTIEKESLDATGLRSDVVTLYHGGQYHLYRYKRFTDVRLVFAPEQDIAFFGGDPDNFEYPRYVLDICFFRVYENDRPAKTTYYIPWSQAGAGDGELTFVAGHPGRTDRQNTVRHLEFLRDRAFPSALATIYRREVVLSTYSERSLENARRAKDELFGIENRRKSRRGGLAGLQDPSIFDRKRREEQQLRQAVAADPKLRPYAGAWDEVARAIDVWDKIYLDFSLLEHEAAFDTVLFDIARTLVRMAEEDAKPNADRLREFRESNRPSLEQSLFSEAPIYADLETVKLADSLGMFLEMAGPDNELVQKTLAGQSPQARAAELVLGTKLIDVDYRKELAQGGRKAILDSPDPMIHLARLVDPPSRAVRKTFEQQVDEPMKQAYGKLAKVRFAVYGTDAYPDATFTLRLALGQVKGYEEEGKTIPPWTTIGGAFQHALQHADIPPFRLPPSWTNPPRQLDLDTPMNFVSTADITGGNSGSPVVNRRGEYVGIIFDGNIQSLVLDFIYTDVQARAVSVHSSAILEALRSVYEADALLEEIQRARRN